MSDAKTATVLEHDTWLYEKNGEGKLFAAGAEHPGKGWSEHPPTYEGDAAAAKAALLPELDKAKARIAELEAEVAAAKAPPAPAH